MSTRMRPPSDREAASLELGLGLVEMIDGSSVFEPTGKLEHARLERDGRFEAEQSPRLADVGEAMPHVAHPIFAGEHGARLALPEDLGQALRELADADGAATRDVDGVTVRLVALERKPERFGD